MLSRKSSTGNCSAVVQRARCSLPCLLVPPRLDLWRDQENGVVRRVYGAEQHDDLLASVDDLAHANSHVVAGRVLNSRVLTVKCWQGSNQAAVQVVPPAAPFQTVQEFEHLRAKADPSLAALR